MRFEFSHDTFASLRSCRGRESYHQDQCEHERAGDVNVSSFHDFDSFELIILFICSLLIDLVPLGGLRSMLILYDSPSHLSCAAGVARIRLQSSAFRKRWCAHFHLDRGPCDFSRFFSFCSLCRHGVHDYWRGEHGDQFGPIPHVRVHARIGQ